MYYENRSDASTCTLHYSGTGIQKGPVEWESAALITYDRKPCETAYEAEQTPYHSSHSPYMFGLSPRMYASKVRLSTVAQSKSRLSSVTSGGSCTV